MDKVTLNIATTILQACERWADLAGYPCSVAVADASGTVVAFHRMDGATPMTTDIAINKAFSAVYIGGPTLRLARMIDYRTMGPIPGSGGLGLLTQNKLRLVFIPGGIPMVNGKMEVIGGIGCSGIPDGVGEISDTTVAQAGYAAVYEEND
ncbi:MAG TPA: heme-binding protein [Firmicutes bacterium]|jgi:cob(I)alamin adenosyltransferase|nr:heme-binding protein [Bacillota bacterium]